MRVMHEELQKAWYRSRAQCECRSRDHGHPGRCTRQMIHPKRGEQTPGGWEAKAEDGASGVACLCWPCYAHGRVPSPPEEGMKRK